MDRVRVSAQVDDEYQQWCRDAVSSTSVSACRATRQAATNVEEKDVCMTL